MLKSRLGAVVVILNVDNGVGTGEILRFMKSDACHKRSKSQTSTLWNIFIQMRISGTGQVTQITKDDPAKT